MKIGENRGQRPIFTSPIFHGISISYTKFSDNIADTYVKVKENNITRLKSPHSNLVRVGYLLRPYAKNISKRVIKSPKLYFTDTGLLAYLLRYPDAATMSTGPQAGAFFENLVLAEILKLKYSHNFNFEPYFFYRDSNHNEIDFVLDYGVAVKVFEVKCTSTLNEKHFASLMRLIKDFKNASGYVVSFVGERAVIARNIASISWTSLKDVTVEID